VKVDFKKTLPAYKAKPKRFDIVEVPKQQYLMIEGSGGPGSADFAAALETLYPVAYGLKFASKQELERDYVVPPLEGLWWADDMAAFTSKFDKSQWDWALMILVPDWISSDFFAQTLDRVSNKKSPPAIDKLTLDSLIEGLCVQTLHLGAYSDEGPVLADMHNEFIPARGLKMTGKHHEIYFNDFRRVAPEKLRTLLRQPVVALGM